MRSRTLAVCSAFRNQEGRIGFYFDRIQRLMLLLGPSVDVHLVLGYGDSRDRTRNALLERGLHFTGAGVTLVDCEHGGPEYGSVEDSGRFKQLAFVANRLLERVPSGVDALLWLEGDILYDPSSMLNLLDDLITCEAVAPMVLHKDDPGLYPGPGPFFYDTYAFRKDGVRFANVKPYHAGVTSGLFRVDSAGSCLAVRGEYVKALRFPEEDVIVGACRSIYEAGGMVWVDGGLSVLHP